MVGNDEKVFFEGATNVRENVCPSKFEGYIYDDGILYEATTQEIWESWGRDLPENTESEDE